MVPFLDSSLLPPLLRIEKNILPRGSIHATLTRTQNLGLL